MIIVTPLSLSSLRLMNCIRNKRWNKRRRKKHVSENYGQTNLLYSHIIKSIVQKRLHVPSLLKCKYVHVIHSLAL